MFCFVPNVVINMPRSSTLGHANNIHEKQPSSRSGGEWSEPKNWDVDFIGIGHLNVFLISGLGYCRWMSIGLHSWPVCVCVCVGDDCIKGCACSIIGVQRNFQNKLWCCVSVVGRRTGK